MRWSVSAASAVYKKCNKCTVKTRHRLVRDSRVNRKNYYSCSICLEKNSKKYRNRYWLRYLAQKANTRKRKGSIEIHEKLLKFIYEEQEGKCALTGIPFDMANNAYKPSLDRIDSTKGYTILNIQLVLLIVNKMKREFPQNEFVDICGKVYCHHNKIHVYINR
jgi:hypothetical protein